MVIIVVGLIITVTVTGAAAQFVGAGPVALMVKVTVVGVVLAFVKVPLMAAPSDKFVPLVATVPVIPAGLFLVQAYFAPTIPLLLFKMIFEIAVPEQMVWLLGRAEITRCLVNG